MTDPVRYTVTLADPAAHRFHVRCEMERAPDSPTVFRLPAWIRGSYLVRDFAKHVSGLRGWGDDQPALIERLDKSAFRVAGAGTRLRVEYLVHAFDESVRKAWLDLDRGFFNGSSLFYCPDGRRDGPFELLLQAPTPPQLADWQVATAMTAAAVDARGFGVYTASDYEELIDHPFELGPFRRLDFAVGEVPHALVLSGRAEPDLARVCADLTVICQAQREMFGNEPALPQYLFLTHAVGSGYGGLEHRASTALICSRNDLPRPGQAIISKEYRTFLGLCSHEYFHLWNVKRITAESFAASDLAREAYSRDLWHYEGLTSYYDDLILLRAGLIDAATYLDLLAENATRLQRFPARRVQTLEDASFETWIKFYQPDDNTPNAATNYYAKGALVALCLDLKLRLESSLTLDEVMRELWRRYGRVGRGVPERGLEQLAGELSGLELQAFFDHALRSTEELPLAELLEPFGVQAEPRACTSAIDDGGRTLARGGLPWLGLRLRAGETTVLHVLDGGPAQRAGLSAGDQLLALDGYKLVPAQWHRRVEELIPGRAVTAHYFRGDQIGSVTLIPQPAPLDTWTLTLADSGRDAARRRLAWLGV